MRIRDARVIPATWELQFRYLKQQSRPLEIDYSGLHRMFFAVMVPRASNRDVMPRRGGQEGREATWEGIRNTAWFFMQELGSHSVDVTCCETSSKSS